MIDGYLSAMDSHNDLHEQEKPMTTVKYKGDLDKEEIEWFANFLQFVKFKREGKIEESVIFKLTQSIPSQEDKAEGFTVEHIKNAIIWGADFKASLKGFPSNDNINEYLNIIRNGKQKLDC